MRTFLKWTITGLMFVALIVFVEIIKGSFDTSRIPYILFVTILGSLFLGLFFYILEVKLVPWRRKSIINKLIHTFNAKSISDSVVQFKIQNLDFYAVLDIALQMTQYGGYLESIVFHIPKDQIDHLPIKPNFKFKESTCCGKQTYRVLQTSGYLIKRSKKLIEKKIRG